MGARDSGPLSGLHFLELGESREAAYAGRLLALLGADITVAERRRPAPSVPALDPLSEGKRVLAPGSRPLAAPELARLPFAGALSTEPIEGASYPVVVSARGGGPLADWACSGLMELTGYADGPPQVGPVALMVGARGAALALALLRRVAGRCRGSPDVAPGPEPDGPALLGERAALTGFHRNGLTSPGGSTRLLPALDGWVALTIARPEDLDLVAAWTKNALESDPWHAAASYVARTEAHRAVERAQLLGLPAAVADEPDRSFDDEQAEARDQRWPPSPYLVDGVRPRLSPSATVRPSALRAPSKRPQNPGAVADLSTLWAGPLATSLLPGRVVKVESAGRPDGARRGPERLFHLLNAGKESVVLDLTTPEEGEVLRRLLAQSSVAVESARSRGLAGLGLDPAELHDGGAPTGWVRITGYGSTGPWKNRVALGDDAAAAGGLAAATGSVVAGSAAGAPGPLHCGDAVADPLTGLHAAVAGAALQIGGGAHVIEVAMREVVGHSLFAGERRALDDEPAGTHQVVWSGGGWRLRCAEGDLPVARPRARRVTGAARPAGADRSRVLASFGITSALVATSLAAS